MNINLSKKDVFELLQIWSKWMNGPDPAKNKPEEYKKWDEFSPNGLRMALGTVAHLFLWCLTKIGLQFGIPSLSIWSSKTSIKYDQFYWEPISCGWNNSYTNMGLGYLKAGNIEKAIECLSKSWRVYPCPHNTTYGLKTKLCKELMEYPEAKEAVLEYQKILKNFKEA